MEKQTVKKNSAHHIPCINIFCIGNKEKIEKNGKYIITIDGDWQYATDNVEDGFYEYISNPIEPDKNGINRSSTPSKSLNLSKKDYDFDGILDYSLDLDKLIQKCSGIRFNTKYFKTTQKKRYCMGIVKINFEKGTKEMREFLYREEGFTITYHTGKKPFSINYVRYKRTASGAREGSCLFIAKDLYEPMMSWSCAGINPKKAKEIDSVSWEAYVALTLSSLENTVVFNPNQILFVKDKEYIAKKGKVFEITTENGNLIQRHNIYTDNNDENTLKNTNMIWDGEGLIDDSLFSENDVLKESYGNKCMLLLRGKFFKACVFRTHIQKWFKDHNIIDVKELNGYTKAKHIDDIKFIIPYSCLKFLKFKNDKTKEEAIKDWIKNISWGKVTPLFGIVKSDKKSKLDDGKKVFTTYQMLNTLGFNRENAEKFLQPTIERMENLTKPGEEGAKNVKKYLDTIFFSPSAAQDNNKNKSSDNSDRFRLIHYKELVASKLLEYNTQYYSTSHYKDTVESLLEHAKNQVKNGRVLIDGVYATLFCNGIELLECTINKDYDPNTNTCIQCIIDGVPQELNVLKNHEIYSKRFAANTELLCARNPHITMGNFYLANNKHPSIYDRYFVLSNEIVCVNAINSDIMNILNGCDFDSDTMLITDNKVMVDLLKRQLTIRKEPNKFRTPFSNLKTTAKKPKPNEKESKFLANVDNKLSNNLIGEVVNLSQRLNSLIWMIAPQDIQDKYYWNKWTADIGKPIYEKGCCTLAVLSNVEIDSAKRSFDCNTSSELKKIRKEIGDKDYELLECYTSWLDTKDKDKYITPEIKPGATIKGFKILGLDPMGYLIEVISEKEERVKKSLCRKTINDYNFIANLLREKDIKDSNSNCEKSLQQCLKALVECNDYLQKQQIAGNNNKYIKRNYAKDYQEINACFHTIDNIFNKATVSVDALLWRLIELEKNSSRLIKNFTNSSSNYVIVDSASNEYKIAKKEKKTHTCPHALLFSALFLAGFDDKTINEAYLTKRL